MPIAVRAQPEIDQQAIDQPVIVHAQPATAHLVIVRARQGIAQQGIVLMGIAHVRPGIAPVVLGIAVRVQRHALPHRETSCRRRQRVRSNSALVEANRAIPFVRMMTAISVP